MINKRKFIAVFLHCVMCAPAQREMDEAPRDKFLRFMRGIPIELTQLISFRDCLVKLDEHFTKNLGVLNPRLAEAIQDYMGDTYRKFDSMQKLHKLQGKLALKSQKNINDDRLKRFVADMNFTTDNPYVESTYAMTISPADLQKDQESFYEYINGKSAEENRKFLHSSGCLEDSGKVLKGFLQRIPAATSTHKQLNEYMENVALFFAEAEHAWTSVLDRYKPKGSQVFPGHIVQKYTSKEHEDAVAAEGFLDGIISDIGSNGLDAFTGDLEQQFINALPVILPLCPQHVQDIVKSSSMISRA